MGLFYKIKLHLAKNGKISLKDCSVEDGFNEEFVEACISGRGYEEFKYASEWLRSDTAFILKMVRNYPEVLNYCAEEIYDRYMDDERVLKEKEIDQFFFAVKCCSVNLRAFRYISDESADKYLQAVKEALPIKGEYHGKHEAVELENSDYIIDKLYYIRYDIVRIKGIVGSI